MYVEGDRVISATDDQYYYTLPYSGMTNDEIKDYLRILWEDENDCREPETYEDLAKKWGDCPDRQKMTSDKEREYVSDWYGIAKNLQTKPFEPSRSDDDEYAGQTFMATGILTEDEADLECLPMWKITMKDGHELHVTCDEIFKI